MRLNIALVALLLTAAGRVSAGDIVSIPAGTFTMGSPADSIEVLKSRYEVGYRGVFENEIPAHQVSLSGFGLDAHEVTNRRFEAFVKTNPEWRPGNLTPERHNGDYLKDWEVGRYPAGQGELPVVFVTWHAAQAFCRWSGGRLPTEAE